MKAFKLITDPSAFPLLGDETRRRIIYLLRAKEMTVSQIAAELNLTPQAIYHHIRKLRDAGMVEVAREERVDHFIETYYRATAEIFNFSHGEGTPAAWAEAKTKEALEGLGKIGIRVRTDPQAIARFAELWKRMEAIGEKRDLTESIAGLEDVDFFVKQEMVHLAKLLSMTDAEFKEYEDLAREYRKLLKAAVEGPVKVSDAARKG
jgi:DNA-binding transcriptional ArsR family regulator